MKKCFWMMAIAAVFSFAFSLTSCGSDSDDPTPTPVIIPVTPAATGVTPGATFTDSCDITFPFALDTNEVTVGKDITDWMVQNFDASARASETVIESLTVKIKVVISETAITVDITGKAPDKTGIMKLSVKVPKDQTKEKIEVRLIDNIWSKTVINPQPVTPPSGGDEQVSDWRTVPLTFEFYEVVKGGKFMLGNAPSSLRLSINGGEKQPYTKGIAVNVGDKISLYADGTGSIDEASFLHITCQENCYIYGNIMSLISSTDFANANSLESHSHAFQNLFWYNTHINSHPTKKLVLPATHLSEYCYKGMFQGCTNLTVAPDLPATYASTGSYENMFTNCEKLTSIKCFLASPSSTATPGWVSGVPSTGTFVKAKDAIWEKGESGIPNGWTVQEESIPKTAATITFGTKSLEKVTTDSVFKNPLTNTGNGTVKYTSSNVNVATVNASTGEVTLVGQGEATITATVTDSALYTYKTNTATYTIIVTAPKLAASITFAETSVTKGIGDSAFTNPITNTGDGAVKYTSSNVNVAKVNESTGEVTIIAEGTAKITATVADSSLYTYATKTAVYTLTVAPKYIQMPLTVEATEKCTLYVSAATNNNGIRYSKNGGTITDLSNISKISLNAGDTVAFYGKQGSSLRITGSGGKKCYVYGNAMSLAGYETGEALEGATTVAADEFYHTFYDNKDIDIAEGKPLILPATTVGNNGYCQMFYRCTRLTRTPEIRATNLGEESCYEMFYGCTSLTKASDICANSFGPRCCERMFYECKALTETPKFTGEIELKERSFQEMFRGCTALKTAHDFKKLTLNGTYCCNYMFYECSKLETAPALPATTLNDYCYNYMFYGCTSLVKAPDLPAKTLARGCYDAMFSGCQNLLSIKCLMNITRSDGYKYLSNWMKDVTNSSAGVFYKDKNVDMAWLITAEYIPSKWKIQDAE